MKFNLPIINNNIVESNNNINTDDIYSGTAQLKETNLKTKKNNPLIYNTRNKTKKCFYFHPNKEI